MLPGLEQFNCQQMEVPLDVMQHVVRVESSYNPYAIGVVGGHLVRQPKNLPEALATVRMLESRGFNFSLGLAQVNRFNLGKYGLDSYEKAFQKCPNLQAGSRILAECYKRLGGDWGKSFSCYYSGNSVTGFRHGYVQKVFASMRESDISATAGTSDAAIEVVSKPSRRVVAVSRHPVYSQSPQPRLQQRIDASVTPASVSPTLPTLVSVQTGQQQIPIATSVSKPVPVYAFADTASPVSLKPTEANGPEKKSSQDDAFVF